MRFILIIFAMYASLFAVGNYPSNIPVPKTYVIQMDVGKCDDNCLLNYYNKGMIFSFISNYNATYASSQLQDKIGEFRGDYFISMPQRVIGSDTKIAILIPKKVIGRYAETAITSIMSYLITQNIQDYAIEVFDSDEEDYQTIKNKVNEIEQKGYQSVIAFVTNTGLDAISKTNSSLTFYIPTINKSATTIKDTNIVFAGIDYVAQVGKLLDFSNDRITILYDNSTVSSNITNIIQQQKMENVVYTREIKNSQTDFKGILDSKFIDNGTVFFNTPLVRSSILASTMTFYNKEPKYILSTQINYKPLLLDLTQEKDRAKMVLANSITKKDSKLEEYNNLLVNDIAYDWINYTSTVCIDIIISGNNKQNSLYGFEVQDNSIVYDIKLYKPINSKLEEILELR